MGFFPAFCKWISLLLGIRKTRIWPSKKGRDTFALEPNDPGRSKSGFYRESYVQHYLILSLSPSLSLHMYIYIYIHLSGRLHSCHKYTYRKCQSNKFIGIEKKEWQPTSYGMSKLQRDLRACWLRWQNEVLLYPQVNKKQKAHILVAICIVNLSSQNLQ